MKDNDKQNKQLESILKRAHIPEPSAELKKRITTEAAKAWNQTSPEISWRIPFRRILVSAAAAVFIIWLANSSSDYTLLRWQPRRIQVEYQQSPNLDTFTEIPYSPIAKRIASTGRSPSMTNASTLRSYIQAMQHILDDAQQNGTSKPPTPVEGGSSLLPKQLGFNSYS